MPILMWDLCCNGRIVGRCLNLTVSAFVITSLLALGFVEMSFCVKLMCPIPFPCTQDLGHSGSGTVPESGCGILSWG